MTRKILALVLALMMMSAVALADVPAFEDIVFPENMPSGIIFADDTCDYSYDDLTTKYDVSIMTENYGVPNQDNAYDPVVYWLNEHFNINITYDSVMELGEVLPARAAADDLPDIFLPPSNSRDWAFELDDAGKLIDCKTIWPYMPLSQKYATQAMIANSVNPETGRIPFLTGYGIQDGTWTITFRADWLEKFGMETPHDIDSFLAYAEAVKTQDPDGNGVDDTYTFAIWRSMYQVCENAYGNSAPHVDEDGKLSHQYFNGIRYNFLKLMKTMNDAGYLHPDWALGINDGTAWNNQKALTANDKIGAYYYPVGTLLGEYLQAKGVYDEPYINAFAVCNPYPFEGSAYPAAGNPGYRWCFPTYGYEDEGKLLRVAHMIDTMRIGGENFAYCEQGGIDEVYEFYAAGHDGIEKNPNYSRSIVYTPEGFFYMVTTDLTPDNKDDNMDLIGNAQVETYDMAAWQSFGLTTMWQLSNPDPEAENAKANAKSNEHTMNTASVNRYPNYSLLYSLSGDAAAAQNEMSDWITASEIAFINGTEELTEESYAAWAQEWLDRGGYEIVKQIADGLGCELYDEMVE